MIPAPHACRRAIVLTVVLAATVSAPAFAQTEGTVRMVRNAVILEAPRGDSPVLGTIPAGSVLEVLGQEGNWFAVLLPPDMSTARRSGWVNAQLVEPLGGEAQASVGRSVPRTLAGHGAARTDGVSVLRPGMTELAFDGTIMSVPFGDERETVTEMSQTTGYFVTRAIEIGLVTGQTKSPGADLTGLIGGIVAVNVPVRGTIVPFASLAAGTYWGYPEVTGNPRFMQVGGGVRAFTPGGGGAVTVEPFYQRLFFPKEGFSSQEYYGLLFGVSIFLGGR